MNDRFSLVALGPDEPVVSPTSSGLMSPLFRLCLPPCHSEAQVGKTAVAVLAVHFLERRMYIYLSTQLCIYIYLPVIASFDHVLIPKADATAQGI